MLLGLSETDSLEQMQAKLDLANVRTALQLFGPMINRAALDRVIRHAYTILEAHDVAPS